MQWIVDRLEEDVAVIEAENGIMLMAHVAALPENTKEGDVLSIEIDTTATQDRKAAMKEKMKRLFEK